MFLAGNKIIVVIGTDRKSAPPMRFTENYIKVEIPFAENLINQIKEVKLKSILPNGNVKGLVMISLKERP